ncbi:maleylpyruvate isomerase family mycothiol-dependent enzyme [Allobranchiibius sp. GilTou38]|uniref:maleylpyruvate isomerase family mycothiol-dependent enzyme n=1 Tax=Allobranchiibius sp. GilTou38 TaxID=2815210 RepID=UPI001AA18E45|nr:maleylpyruvate isomerase family mycothiol-dependent enzyme [Allobranchiibius sp. GilTou38]MBO1765398.1 maleylpyruvate isomerase family mycothiol-dependent enzyme [Allobranchiibius sp. GilTou38]
MQTHPQPPVELPELVDAFAATGQSILDLGLTCHPEDFDKPTALPGWTVKDVFAHVAGTEHLMNGGQDREIEVPDYEWIRNDAGRFMERAVEVRRGRSGGEIVNEWRDLLPKRIASYRDPTLNPETVIQGPFGPMELTAMLHLRLIDLWCHEQDLRDALHSMGNLDSAGAAAFTSDVLAAFPARAARRADLEVGSVVIIECTGPVMARQGIRIVEGSDGRPYAESLFSGTAHVDKVDDETGEIIPLPLGKITTIRLSTESLTRRGAGRISTADLRYSVEGDEAAAARVLDVLTITP